MRLTEDQHAVEELAAQGAEEAFAGRVHPGAWTAVCRILAPFAWKTASKDRVKFVPRSRIRNRKFSNPLAESESEVAGLLYGPFARGFAVTPPRCIRRVPCSMNTKRYSRFSSTVSTWRPGTGRSPSSRWRR
jgi:hypothetical protein